MRYQFGVANISDNHKHISSICSFSSRCLCSRRALCDGLLFAPILVLSTAAHRALDNNPNPLKIMSSSLSQWSHVRAHRLTFPRHLSTHSGHDAVIVCLMFPLHTHRSSSGKRPSFLRFSSASAEIEVVGKHSYWLLSICKIRDGVILDCQGKIEAQSVSVPFHLVYFTDLVVIRYSDITLGEKWSLHCAVRRHNAMYVQ